MLLPDNLMNMQCKLLCLHHHFGHQSMTTIQEWARTGYHGVPPDIAKYKIPLCRGCQFGAAKRHSHKQDKGSLSKSTEEPGDFVSVDQMVAGTPSLIPFHAGSKHWYNCAMLWCDHTSWFLWSHLQESTNAVTTLKSKVSFKTFARQYNQHIKHIHSNNQIFNSKVFMQSVKNSDQSQSFCGVGAHWQNGVIECHIGIITTHAHMMLLHAMSYWPKIITSEFWSFAFMQAVNQHNSFLQRGQSKSPFTLFTNEDCPLKTGDFQYLAVRSMSLALTFSLKTIHLVVNGPTDAIKVSTLDI